MTSATEPKFLAPSFEWTDDCQGKKDYDGRLLSVSSRYWPPSYNRDGKHTAVSSIAWGDLAEGPYVDLARREFSAESLDEVKRLVEAWVQEQSREFFAKIVRP